MSTTCLQLFRTAVDWINEKQATKDLNVNGKELLLSSSAVSVAVVALLIIAAAGCAGACSHGALGGIQLAAAGTIICSGIAYAVRTLGDAKQKGDTERADELRSFAWKVVAASVALSSMSIILGACTAAGAIPIKTMGWIIIAPLSLGCCSSSSLASSWGMRGESHDQ